jgi:serine/threonine protein kinase
MVAVKVLRPELAAVIGAERFMAEIKLTASLQHPHILPLFDSGRGGGVSQNRRFRTGFPLPRRAVQRSDLSSSKDPIDPQA